MTSDDDDFHVYLVCCGCLSGKRKSTARFDLEMRKKIKKTCFGIVDIDGHK